jgi:hypothetical protein
MHPIARARELKQRGLFSDALKVLNSSQVPSHARIAADVLRTELLETTGEYDHVLGRIDAEQGELHSGIAHFHRSVLRAQQARDVKAEFDSRIQLFNFLFERLGPAGSTSLLSDIRRLATRLADPRCTAKLHLFVASMEARRGLFSNARRHITIARNLLKDFPHEYCEAFAANIELGICVMQSEFEAAQEARGARRTTIISVWQGRTGSNSARAAQKPHVRLAKAQEAEQFRSRATVQSPGACTRVRPRRPGMLGRS